MKKVFHELYFQVTILVLCVVSFILCSYFISANTNTDVFLLAFGMAMTACGIGMDVYYICDYRAGEEADRTIEKLLVRIKKLEEANEIQKVTLNNTRKKYSDIEGKHAVNRYMTKELIQKLYNNVNIDILDEKDLRLINSYDIEGTIGSANTDDLK